MVDHAAVDNLRIIPGLDQGPRILKRPVKYPTSIGLLLNEFSYIC